MNQKTDEYTWGEIGVFAFGALFGALVGVVALVYLADAMANQAPGFWFVSRAAGIVAYVMLWFSTAWGVAISSKAMGRLLPGPLVFTVHNITSWLALGFSVVHGLSLLGDRVVSFTLVGLAVPFAAAYQPLLTGAGTLSLYVGVLVSLAFYMKRRIGYRAWRTIHGLSYLMFIVATVHSIALGTDTGTLPMRVVYLLAGGSVMFLTVFRLLTAGSNRAVVGEGRPA